MYTGNANQILHPHEFFLPFDGRLSEKNRWCRITMLMPWAELERLYVKKLLSLGRGRKAYSVRMALGALLIAQICVLSDEETVAAIQENPYMQYLLGLSGFQEEPVFNASLMVYFRRRLGGEPLEKANEIVAMAEVQRRLEEKAEEERRRAERERRKGKGSRGNGAGGGSIEIAPKAEQQSIENCGNLILDATCVPADIHFPTDLRLLNEAREWTEEIIDIMHAPDIGIRKKPRTYREEARQAYLTVAKSKRAKYKTIRKAIRKQLQYLKRNLGMILIYEEMGRLSLLSRLQRERLETCRKVYEQQKEYYETGKSPEDRIVSLHMPFVRPIKRGKAGAETEFGAKVSISVVEGMVFVDRISFDNFNEGITLIESAERYRERCGFYPEAIMADKLFRNRENLNYCKERNIRLSGKPLGRPRSDPGWRIYQRALEQIDAGIRNAVEGKFGEGKRSYGLDRIRTRMEETSRAVIVTAFMAMNLKRILRVLLCASSRWFDLCNFEFLPGNFIITGAGAA